MKPYRIKHLPSGLYYQPVNYVKTNLGKKGKVYLTGISPLTSKEDYIYIQVNKDTRIFKLVKDLFPLNTNGDIRLKVSKVQFQIEEIKL